MTSTLPCEQTRKRSNNAYAMAPEEPVRVHWRSGMPLPSRNKDHTFSHGLTATSTC